MLNSELRTAKMQNEVLHSLLLMMIETAESMADIEESIHGESKLETKFHINDLNTLIKVVSDHRRALDASFDDEMTGMYKEYKAVLENNRMELEGAY